MWSGWVSNLNTRREVWEKRRRWSTPGPEPATFQMRVRHKVFMCYSIGIRSRTSRAAAESGANILYMVATARRHVAHATLCGNILKQNWCVCSRLEYPFSVSQQLQRSWSEKMNTSAGQKAVANFSHYQGSNSRMKFKLGTLKYETDQYPLIEFIFPKLCLF